ncbi:MAG: ubiquitin-like small modifier protein 1 [Candidatus Thorarchaeota archaeon]
MKFYAHLRDQIGGLSTLELYLEDTARVAQVLEKICENIKIRNALLDEDQNVKDDITLLKNGREIKFLNGLETPLVEGDEIAIFPLVAGG